MVEAMGSCFAANPYELFMVGSQDRQVPPEAVRVGCDAFAREGHPVEFRVIEGFGHGWPQVENERVWEFLAGKRLAGGGGAEMQAVQVP
jgi:hypothetical protein